MKRIIIAGLLLSTLSVSAQDTYENARLLGSDLNGTARYVGMGGALEALGADISTISTNPAGIGMFRHSSLGLSLGTVVQEGAESFDNLSKANMSFDQVGFVYSNRTGASSYVNFAFNYHKSRNFDQILAASNLMNHASLSKLAYAKSTFRSDTNGGYDLGYNTGSHRWMGYRNPDASTYAYPFTQWDYLYTNVYNIDDVNGEGDPLFSEAEDYYFDKAHRGWIADYDFNLSGNINNRVYWGFTIGYHDVKYKSYSLYDEMMVNRQDERIGRLMLEDEHHIDGNGLDFKLGFIFLPIDESPFRIGVSATTPTWYDLKSTNWTTLHNNTYVNEYADKLGDFDMWGLSNLTSEHEYPFKYYTPWKFGLSLGHTIGNYLALGASYEYSDYASAKTREYDGTYDYYDGENTVEDREMTQHTRNSLKGVSLFKVGAEFKPDPSLAVRLGYNHQSAAYNDNAVRNTRLDSPGTYYSSTPDYVNWKGTNRITAGLGYKYEHLSLDLAYQFSTTSGTFYPFQPNVEFDDPILVDDKMIHETNFASPSSVDFKRHQLLFTATYTF